MRTRAQRVVLATMVLFFMVGGPTLLPAPPAPPTFHHWHQRMRRDVVRECLDGVVSVVGGGRFGNRFMEYASALAVARLHGLALVLPEAVAQTMRKAFEGVKEPTLREFLRKRTAPDGRPCFPRVTERDVGSSRRWNASARDVEAPPGDGGGNGPIVLPRAIVLAERVAALAPELRRRLRFRRPLRNRAHLKLRAFAREVASATGAPLHQVVFVGVHARRGDYDDYLRQKWHIAPTNESYYVRAVARLSALLEKELAKTAKVLPLVVTLVSDEMFWVENTLMPALRDDVQRRGANGTQVFASGGARTLQDLALLASCNHSIISYGTFSATAALLAGGHTIAYEVDNFQYIGAREISRVLPQWIVMK